MKRLPTFLFFAGVLSAQYAAVPGSQYPALESILNAKPAMTKAAGVPSGNCTQSLDLYLNTATGDLYVCSATNTWLKVTGTGGGSGITTMTIGAADPVASCTAPSTSTLALYTQTTTQDIWGCVATNTWKKLLSTNNTGTYVATGTTGTSPSNPASGDVTCYYSSVSLTQICLDASGNASSSVRTAAGRTANQFVTHVPATGIPATAAIAVADLAAITGLPADATEFLNGTGVFSTPAGGGGGTATKICTIAFSNAGLIANSTTADINCGSPIAANTKVIGVTIKHSAAFAGTGITTVTASLGVGSSAPLSYSGTALDVFQTAGTTGGKYLDSGGWGSYSMASHQPTVRLTGNVAFGNGATTVLTAGSLDVWIMTVVLP